MAPSAMLFAVAKRPSASSSTSRASRADPIALRGLRA